MAQADASGAGFPQFSGGKLVLYCGVTGLPLEYTSYTAPSQRKRSTAWWAERAEESVDHAEARAKKTC